MNRGFLFILILVFSSCGRGKKEVEPIRPVLVDEVSYAEKIPVMYFSGFSKPEKSIDVSFRVDGLIEKLPIKVGDRVKKGQLIAKLDDQDYKLELQEANASLEEALAEDKRASAQYKRIKTLYESESASRDELDTARADFEAAQAAVEKTMSRLDLAKKRLGYTRLYADKNYCEVSEKKAEVFENIIVGQPIATLSCGSVFEVEIAVPETSINEIYRGQKIEVEFNAVAGKRFSGKVKEVGVTAAGGTAFPVTILLDKPSNQIRSGMAAKAIVYGSEEKKRVSIIVPLASVMQDKGVHYVYVFIEENGNIGIVKKKQVKIGEVLPNGITIMSGVKPGDDVVTAGLRFLEDGQKVKRKYESHTNRI